jgi:26S proteasome regulatory subunit T4
MDLSNLCAQFHIGRNLLQAVRKLNEAKKLESSAHYNADFGKD